MRSELHSIVSEIRQERYPQSSLIFLAGSVLRGEATATSDLDLVVLFENLPHAYRESFMHGKWPVEAFVHDPQTLEYFFREVDRPSGFPALPTMVQEAMVIPEETEYSQSLKQLAQEVLDEGPSVWNNVDVNNSRYAITDLIDDIREPRSVIEMHAIASQLYPLMLNHYFRSRGLWSAKGKTAVRILHAVDPEFANKFCESFNSVYAQQSTQDLIEVAEILLKPNGGFLFAGHSLDAPASWRIPDQSD